MTVGLYDHVVTVSPLHEESDVALEEGGEGFEALHRKGGGVKKSNMHTHKSRSACSVSTLKIVRF